MGPLKGIKGYMSEKLYSLPTYYWIRGDGIFDTSVNSVFQQLLLKAFIKRNYDSHPSVTKVTYLPPSPAAEGRITLTPSPPLHLQNIRIKDGWFEFALFLAYDLLFLRVFAFFPPNLHWTHKGRTATWSELKNAKLLSQKAFFKK